METEKLLETIIKEIVKNPDEVKIEKQVDEMGVLLSVKLNPEDVGLVIGRQGNIISAIRVVIQTIGRKNRAAFSIKLIEPEKRFEKGFNQQKQKIGKENIDNALGKL